MSITTDTDREHQIERHILATITTATGDCAGELALLANCCPPPLVRWFTDPLCQVLAIAADDALTGVIPTTATAIVERATTIPHSHAMDIRQGKRLHPWSPCPYEESALANVGGWTGLAGLRETGMAFIIGKSGIESHAPLLRHAGDRRRIIGALQEGIKAVASSSLTSGPYEETQSAQDRLQGMLASPSELNLGDHLHMALRAGEVHASLRERGQAPAATWGIPALDVLVPLRPGALVVLAAAPGVGKTSLMLQSSVACAKAGGRGAVAIAALEMTGSDLATIIAARHVGIAPAAIRERSPSVPTEAWERLEALADQWRDASEILVRDSAASGDRITVTSVCAWLTQRRRASPRMSLAMLDYLQLLDPTNPRQTEYDRINEATRTLKRAATSLRLPILCLSQMNRAGRAQLKDKSGRVIGDPEPSLADLRGSGSIEQDADAVVFLHALGEPNPTAASILVRATVAKNRAGPLGTLDLWFNRRQQTFEVARAAGSNVDSMVLRAARMSSAPQDSELEAFS